MPFPIHASPYPHPHHWRLQFLHTFVSIMCTIITYHV